MEGFAELAAGARELRVILHKGDIVVRVTEGATWSLEWTSDGDVAPNVARDGPVLQVRQQMGHCQMPSLARVDESGQGMHQHHANPARPLLDAIQLGIHNMDNAMCLLNHPVAVHPEPRGD